MEFQTRNEEGEILFFGTLKEAFAHAERDKSVWKVSFSLPWGERVRLVKDGIGDTYWRYEPIELEQ